MESDGQGACCQTFCSLVSLKSVRTNPERQGLIGTHKTAKKLFIATRRAAAAVYPCALTLGGGLYTPTTIA